MLESNLIITVTVTVTVNNVHLTIMIFGQKYRLHVFMANRKI